MTDSWDSGAIEGILKQVPAGRLGRPAYVAAADTNGHVPVPQGPGLGVEIDWDWVSRHQTAVVEYE
jgi:L-alanine-DL-glutamate epimerase-like enolase superfamily enzyme